MSKFSTLKRASKENLDKLTQELDKLQNNNTNNGPDERFWRPTLDKAGNGQAVIRFLPAPDGENTPVVRYWEHGFQGPGGWYIEKSLTTFDEPDPVAELNGRLWNSGNEKDKDVARKQKRKLRYVSNVYVVRDPGNPENEGKVFLFVYGKKIYDKLKDAMRPVFEGDEKMNPFDLWQGANLKLRVRKVEGYPNYDKSEFESPAPLASDEEMEAIWNKEHSLQELLDRKNFKSYEQLQARLNKILGIANGSRGKPQTARAEEVSNPWDDDVEKEQKTSTKSSHTSSVDDEYEDEESISFFKELKNRN